MPYPVTVLELGAGAKEGRALVQQYTHGSGGARKGTGRKEWAWFSDLMPEQAEKEGECGSGRRSRSRANPSQKK